MLYLIGFRLWQKGKSFFIQNVAFLQCVQDQIKHFSKLIIDVHYLKVSLFHYYHVDTYISVISICQSAWAIKNKEKNRILLMIERKSSTNRHRYPSNQTKYWFLWKKFSTWASKSCIPTTNLVFALSSKLESICIYQRRRNCMVHDLDNSHKYFMYSKWFDRKPGPFKTVRNHSPTLLLFYDKRKIK